jgi:hypothetical protein
VVSRTVYTIFVCGLRAVINIPNIELLLPVVDRYGVLAGAIPPFPIFSHRIFAPRTPIRRDPSPPRADQARVLLGGSSSKSAEPRVAANLIWLSSLSYVYSSV